MGKLYRKYADGILKSMSPETRIANRCKAIFFPKPLLSAGDVRAIRSPNLLQACLIPHSITHILGVLPARWGSTRFPGKPLHLIAGKPLIQHVWERCQQCSRLDEILVATDDERILRGRASPSAARP